VQRPTPGTIRARRRILRLDGYTAIRRSRQQQQLGPRSFPMAALPHVVDPVPMPIPLHPEAARLGLRGSLALRFGGRVWNDRPAVDRRRGRALRGLAQCGSTGAADHARGRDQRSQERQPQSESRHAHHATTSDARPAALLSASLIGSRPPARSSLARATIASLTRAALSRSDACSLVAGANIPCSVASLRLCECCHPIDPRMTVCFRRGRDHRRTRIESRAGPRGGSRT